MIWVKKETCKNAYNVQCRESLVVQKEEDEDWKDFISILTQIIFKTKMQDFLNVNIYMGERQKGKMIRSHNTNLCVFSPSCFSL